MNSWFQYITKVLKIGLITLFFFFATFFCVVCNAACSVTDGFHQTIQLPHPAKRIVSLTPSTTEMLFRIGAGNQLVGVIAESNYPLEARKVRRIGSNKLLDLKAILALHPDLIVTRGGIFSSELALLKKQGIPIYATYPQQLEDIPLIMKQLGCLSGKRELAKREADDFLFHLNKIRQQYRAEKPLTVFFQIGADSLVTINKHSWINQVITLCGGRNVFADAKTNVKAVSQESVVFANPEVIISDTKGETWKNHWKIWDSIAAVKHHWLFDIDPDLIELATPRVLEGTQKVCEYLQTARSVSKKTILAHQKNINGLNGRHDDKTLSRRS